MVHSCHVLVDLRLQDVSIEHKYYVVMFAVATFLLNTKK